MTYTLKRKPRPGDRVALNLTAYGLSAGTAGTVVQHLEGTGYTTITFDFNGETVDIETDYLTKLRKRVRSQ